MGRRDGLFDSGATDEQGRFVFTEQVAAVFEDMVERSVPGYRLFIETTGTLAALELQTGDRVYDLGTSLGASLGAVSLACRDRELNLCGVDNSAGMLERCRQNLANVPSNHHLDLLNQNIEQVNFLPCRLVIMNLTLQFIRPEGRDKLLKDIFTALQPGGLLLLTEKVISESGDRQAVLTALHEKSKKLNGYSELEIARKRTALENVLISESEVEHRNRLLSAGFAEVTRLASALNFTMLCARRL